MSRQGNRRTTKEGSTVLKSQNLGLSPNRSWPYITAIGQHRTISENCSSYDRNIAKVADGAKESGEEDYEDPKTFPMRGFQSMKILPARPIEESQYADTRCFQEMMNPHISIDTKTNISLQQQEPWDYHMRPEEEMQILADIKDLNLKGESEGKGIKNPLPPPRPPNTLPKKYRPLPPEPEKNRLIQNQRSDFLKIDKRQISLKDLSDVHRGDKVLDHLQKPVLPCQTQHHLKDLSVPVASSLFMMADPSFQDKGQKVSIHPPSPQRSPQPAPDNLLEDKPLPTSLHPKKPCHGKSSKKEGTFLVRDGSKKSVAEPYVLVVFHRKKVYNIKIRFLERSHQFALGTGLRGNDKFDSVEDIIEYHKYFPIGLIDGKDQTGTREYCYLKQPLSPSRIYSS
ncbi:cytokine-dependent hematopoietic cell linker isoform X5 [Macrotis lagotis]|uniref:cytokine-dependent hematopoietic cell linker isoform X5 n=1 Tax=Macrotis lagotis TaxID=92651 RepID=UPI003D697173